MEMQQNSDTPKVFIAQSGSSVKWLHVALIAAAVTVVAGGVGWSMGRGANAGSATGTGTMPQLSAAERKTASVQHESPVVTVQETAVKSAEPLAAIPLPPAPPKPSVISHMEPERIQRKPATPRPLALLPWRRFVESPDEADVTPGSLPWKREKGEYETVTVQQADLPWKRGLESPDPVHLEMAELPWKLYFGR